MTKEKWDMTAATDDHNHDNPVQALGGDASGTRQGVTLKLQSSRFK
jgi:hypothetical protein